MDIEALPPNVLLKIFHYLPFKEQIRNARVSKLFQAISNSAVAEMTELKVDENLVYFAISNGLKLFLANCSPKLRRIIVEWPPATVGTKGLNLIIGFLLDLPLPNVTDIQFGLDMEDHRGLDLIQRCPNLKKVRFENFKTKIEKLDEMFDVCPKLESVNISWHLGLMAVAWFAENRMEKLSKVWRLSDLKNLILECVSVNDAVFEKMARHFPYLETLHISGKLEITDDTIRALSVLKNLRSLQLIDLWEGKIFYSAALERLSECENLMALVVENYSIPPETFVSIVLSCKKLTIFKLHSVNGVRTPDIAVEILESFSDLDEKSLAINFCNNQRFCLPAYNVNVNVWEVQKVKEALKKLEKKIVLSIGY